MKRLQQILWLGIIATILPSSAFAAADIAGTMRGFEDRPGYVQPIATLFGTLQNSGWVSSARVGKSFGWTFSLGVPVAYIGTADHAYDYTYNTGCAELRAAGRMCDPSFDSHTIAGASTIWGPDMAPVSYQRYVADASSPTGVVQVTQGNIPDGNSDVREVTTLPFLTPRIAFSANNFRGVLAGMFIPKVNVLSGFSQWGLGVQYDYTRFLPPAVAAKDFNLGVAGNFSKWHIGYAPQKEVSGQLNLDGLVTQVSLVGGYRFGVAEVFTELGYETSSFKSSGNMVEINTNDPITPKVDVDGRNGFRMSLNVAMHLGTWQPVVGQTFGAQWGTTANILQFGKEGQQ